MVCGGDGVGRDEVCGWVGGLVVVGWGVGLKRAEWYERCWLMGFECGVGVW